MPKVFFTLLFDPELEQGVREFWKDLEAIGIRYDGGERYRPHVTLSGFDIPDPALCADTLQKLSSSHRTLPIRLHHLGLFPELSVLFLEPRMTSALAELHRDVIHQASRLSGVSPPFAHYAIDTWVPHCTLAVNVPSNVLGNAVAMIHANWRVLEGHAVGIGLFVPPKKSDLIRERFRDSVLAG